jgi:hypothetical protein
MKGQYRGPMAVDDLFQAIYQDRCFFRRHGIVRVRSAYLYFTPCDERGDRVAIYDPAGNPVDGYVSAGGYRSAAEIYDPGTLEPQTVTCAAFPILGAGRRGG